MADGALNQSMDDILAQIRKIIAEEPVVVPAKPSIVRTAAPGPAIQPPPVAPILMPALVPSPSSDNVAPVKLPMATLDDLSDLLESDEPKALVGAATTIVTPAVTAPDITQEIASDALVAIATVPAPTADGASSDAAPAGASELNGLALPLEPLTSPEADHVVAAETTAILSTPPADAFVAGPVEPPAPALQPAAIDPRPDEKPVALPASPPEVSSDVTLSATPVTLSSLIGNRVDTQRTRGPLPVPTHIGRSSNEPRAAASAAPLAQALPIVVAPIEAAAAMTSSALGALAAGLAASVHAAPALPPPAATLSPEEPNAAGSSPVLSPSPMTSPEVPSASPSVDQIMEALRPILKDWLAVQMPRVVDEALQAELPQLIGRARDAASKL